MGENQPISIAEGLEELSRVLNQLRSDREASGGDRLLDYEETAQRLGVGVDTVRRWVSIGILRPLVADHATVRFHWPSVIRQLEHSDVSPSVNLSKVLSRAAGRTRKRAKA